MAALITVRATECCFNHSETCRTRIQKASSLLFTGSVLAAAAERNSNDTAGEGYEQSVVVFIQLQAQNPPVLLTLNVASGRAHHRTLVYAQVYISAAAAHR